VLQITIGSANASRISLAASPALLPSTGGSSTITASVFDAAGNPLSNVSVFFSTDAGALSAASAATDASGRAAVTLTTTRKATVTATVGGGTTSGSGNNTTDTRTAQVVVDLNVAGGATLRCLSAGTTTPTVGCTEPVGTAVAFTIERSTTTGASAITSASLDFGDGTSTNLGPVTTATVTHTYQATGTYIATLRTTDATGETASVTNTVIITPRTPLNVSLEAKLGDAVIGVGRPVTFTATVTPSTELIESYTWDFGDGTTVTTSGNVTTHVYTSNGVKRATVTVKAADGRSASASVDFIISGV
jgi:PKD repeat protein